MEVTWFGHSTFRIKTGNTTVLIDPFFVGNPAAPTSHNDIEACDLILITHDHADHVGQALELAIKHDAEVVAIFDCVQSLLAQGLPEHLGVGMNIGGTVERNGIAIKMVQAMHSTVNGAAAGFILTLADDTCVYISGDTGVFGDMALFAKFHDIDVAMLPTGGRFTMDAIEAAYACSLLRCKKVIPHHWGTWGILDQSTDTMAEALRKTAPDTEMVELAINEPTTV